MPKALGSDGNGNFGAARVNEFIYKHMTSALTDRREGETVINPLSSIAERSSELVEGLRGIGIEDERVTAIAAIAHVHHCRFPVVDAIESFDELAALMEEAPGA